MLIHLIKGHTSWLAGSEGVHCIDVFATSAKPQGNCSVGNWACSVGNWAHWACNACLVLVLQAKAVADIGAASSDTDMNGLPQETHRECSAPIVQLELELRKYRVS